MNPTNIDIIMWIIAAVLAIALMLEIARRYKAAREKGQAWLREQGYLPPTPEEADRARREDMYGKFRQGG